MRTLGLITLGIVGGFLIYMLFHTEVTCANFPISWCVVH